MTGPEATGGISYSRCGRGGGNVASRDTEFVMNTPHRLLGKSTFNYYYTGSSPTPPRDRVKRYYIIVF